MRALIEPIEFRAKGARTRQPRAQRSAALGLLVPHTRRRAESAKLGPVSRFQRSKPLLVDRVSQGVAAGLMSGGTFGASVGMKMKQKSPNQPGAVNGGTAPQFQAADPWPVVTDRSTH